MTARVHLAPGAVPGLPGQAVAASFAHTWTAWDGTAWDLSSPSSGVRLLRGYRGVGTVAHDRYASTSPALAGSTWRGWRAREREVFWPLLVYRGPGQEWVDYDSAFWQGLHPERVGAWTITHPNGAWRKLQCRLVDDGGFTVELDPAFVGWARYGATLVAEQPFWEGKVERRTFGSATPVDFYDPAGSPAFHITSGSTLAGASINNPGDVAAWPKWTITAGVGGITDTEVGVDGGVIEVPVALAEGESITIDTRPTEGTAVDGTGVDRFAELGAWDPRPVPPGQPVPLSLSLVGAGTVTAELTPLYLRAW